METLSVVTCMSSVLVFILLAAPGFFASRRKMLSSVQIDGLSVLLVNFLWPAMVIDAMASVTINDEIFRMVIYTGGITTVVYVISVVIGFFYLKIRKTPKVLTGMLVFAIAFNNTGLIGMPFIKAVLGSEALFLASIVELVNDIFIFSVGIMFIQSGQGEKMKMDYKSLLSPGFLSVIIGLVIFLFHVNIPSILAEPIGFMSEANTAVAMFLVGAGLGEVSIKALFKEKMAYEISLFRLILIPFILFVILFVFKNNRTLADMVLVVMFGMPSAASTAIFARQYKGDYHLATNCVMLTTLCSIITLPLWLMITSYF